MNVKLTPRISINLATLPFVDFSHEAKGSKQHYTLNVGNNSAPLVIDNKAVEILENAIENYASSAMGRYFCVDDGSACRRFINLDIATVIEADGRGLKVCYPGGEDILWAEEGDTGKQMFARYLEYCKEEDRNEAHVEALLAERDREAAEAGEENPSRSDDARDSTPKRPLLRVDFDDDEPSPEGDVEELIKRYGRDISADVAKGKIPPIIGREDEIREMQIIFTQTKRANVLLLGEAGVGKSALVGEYARRNPNARVIYLNTSAADATKWKGEAESRIFPVLDYVISANREGKETVIFLDELHASVQAGASSTSLPLLEALKKYLEDPDFRCIGATTERECYKYISHDGALERRFRPVLVSEPDKAQTLAILDDFLSGIAKKHDIFVLPTMAERIYDLTEEWMRGLHQPDKSISIADNACARLVVSGEKALLPQHLLESLASEMRAPLEFFREDMDEKYRTLERALLGKIHGQDDAVSSIASRLRHARGGFGRGGDALNSALLLMGPSGAGRVSTAYAIAGHLCGGRKNALYFDMSLFTDPYTARDALLGTQAHSNRDREEGKLTGAVRRKPFVTVIFDNIDKAHEDVRALARSIIENGGVADNFGKWVSFKNTVLVMTSTDHADTSGLADIAHTVKFSHLDHSAGHKILRGMSVDMSDEVYKKYGVRVDVPDSITGDIAARCAVRQSGARGLMTAFEKAVAGPLFDWLMDQDSSVKAQFMAFATGKTLALLTVRGVGDGFKVNVTNLPEPLPETGKNVVRLRRPKQGR